jgi:hypothetical protein
MVIDLRWGYLFVPQQSADCNDFGVPVPMNRNPPLSPPLKRREV